jgi:hypothetical protein
MTKEELLTLFENILREHDTVKAIKHMNAYHKDDVRNYTSFLDGHVRKQSKVGTPSERMYCIQNNINSLDDHPKCVICGDYASFENFSKGYNPSCGLKCGAKNRVEKEKEKYGGKYRFQTDEFKSKAEQTNVDKYGVTNAMQAESVKEKQKQTIIETYGCENISQLEEIKDKKKATSKEHYGTDYPWQSEKGKEEQRQGVKEKYGVDNVSQIQEVKDKKEQTSLQNWSVPNVSQNVEIRQRILESSGIDYLLPNGNSVKIDSEIEKKWLDYIFSKYDISDVDVQPKIKVEYDDNGKFRVWFPDVLIKSKNLLCEIKHYNFCILDEELIKKLSAVKGYTPALMVYYEYTFLSKKFYELFIVMPVDEHQNWICKCVYKSHNDDGDRSRIVVDGLNNVGFKINKIIK